MEEKGGFMKNKLRILAMTVLTLALVGMIAGFWLFVAHQAEIEKEREESLAIDAMYVEIGSHGEYMFVNVDTETVFQAELPKGQVFKGDGETLAPENISTGDVFRIYGDGAMTMSIPAQYPGVTRMVRIKYGSPEDAEQYSQLLEQFQTDPIFTEEEGIIPPQ